MSDGGPAFPHGNARGVPAESFGLSIRDYFAAKALQGILASGRYGAEAAGDLSMGYMAYSAADEMIAARKKETSPRC